MTGEVKKRKKSSGPRSATVLLVDSSEEEPRLLHNVMSNKIALEFATTSRGLTGLIWKESLAGWVNVVLW